MYLSLSPFVIIASLRMMRNVVRFYVRILLFGIAEVEFFNYIATDRYSDIVAMSFVYRTNSRHAAHVAVSFVSQCSSVAIYSSVTQR